MECAQEAYEGVGAEGAEGGSVAEQRREERRQHHTREAVHGAAAVGHAEETRSTEELTHQQRLHPPRHHWH